MAQKPNTPKGTRDFATLELAKRNYIIDKIKTQFKHFGFQAIETPAFENNDTLLGKYGDEGDRLIFKILNSGDFLAKVPQDILQAKDSAKAAAYLTEKALRYDLTVPFARFVVQHQNDLVFPFKRYQIQPVWRADRPQKGRFREFYQCDADVVGSKSLWQEVEFILLYDRVFNNLQLPSVTIKINHRKILSGLAVLMNAEDKLIDFTVALDKLDKIGKEAVIQELLDRGISQQAIDKLNPVFDISGNFSEKLTQLESLFQGNRSGLEGIQELKFIEAQVAAQGLRATTLRLDLTLARGLNYYTGAILEVAAPASVGIGSIGGGGRYDDLTGVFGLKNISGVGVSFGLDRIYIALETLRLFPETISESTQVLFVNFGDTDAAYAFDAVQKLREKGVIAELYPDAAKPQKQLAYADKRHIPMVVFVGEAERKNQVFTLKNMKTGEQKSLTFAELAALFVHEDIA
ncbi:MAG: histidine--tRNA ligase [Bacteroidetes bacterium]|nr:histidine--tRNA ligase [Bacteroidota bacterium]